MNETQRNIKALKAALPELREKVAAVALLLLMSAVMMTSATFAWITLSRAPEVSNVSTTVAANGNLEIALATDDGTISPGESKVGDSSAAEGQTIVNSNVTWGNLINLSDSAYGLENLTLRPAQLNYTALLTSPLYSTAYGNDGRVEKLTSNFSYTSWISPEGNKEGYFGVANSLGVRAISSTKLEAVGFMADYLALKETANGANALAGTQYATITQNDEYMDVLGRLMGIHMTANLNSEDKYQNAEVSQEDLAAFISMYEDFVECYKQEAEAIAASLNLQLFLAYGGDTTKYTAYTASSVLNLSANSGNDFILEVPGETSSKTVKITNFKTFISDYKMLTADLMTMREIAAAGDLRWTASGLKAIVNRMVNIDECTIAKTGEEPKTVKALLAEFSSNISSALGYMNADVDAVITNGVLYNLAQRVAVRIEVGPLPITATMYVSSLNMEQSATVYATITTSAAAPYEFAQDLAYADGLNTGMDSGSMTVTAEDTYALAVDFWVRTNAPNTYLTLEGNILYDDGVDTQITTLDPNGNTVNMYTLTRSETVENEDGSTTMISNTYDLYQITTKTTAEDGSETETTQWYTAVTHSAFELQEGEEPALKVEKVYTIIGYEGENRVWDTENDQFLSTDSTTQGSGSCYVYYADTPEDQARSLKLLEAFNVAFIDSEGTLLAIAHMDTEKYFAENGRVIVPLVLGNSAIDLGEDYEGNTTLAITALEQNEPMLITALVYLDGTKLTNQDVLAASDIQGQLNIQFGSSADLRAIDNEELYQEVRRVSASIPESETSFDYDTYEGDMTSNVTVTVDGDQPTTVSAFFIRAINATQGARETSMVFTETDDGTWVSSHTFTAPGTYILRTVMLDGAEYPLAETPTVVVEGFAVKSLTCTEATNNHVNVMTADPSTTVHMKLQFAADDMSKMPSTVQGRFLNDEDGAAVNVNFKLDVTTQMWTGTATFQKSGNYTMEYLVLDGEYAALDEGLVHTASVKLGMRVAVYTTSPNSFKYLPSEMTDNQKLLGMQVKIMDNAGNEMPGLSGAKLTYRMQGSAVNTMDTDLTWDGRYYVGELKTLESGGPGTWIFSNVSVGGNNLTTATTSPTFLLISPEPPSYAGITNKAEYQFMPDGGAVMEANVKYSATATVIAAIKNEDTGETVDVQGTQRSTDADNVTTWNFAIPTNANGAQDGRWTMTELRVWNFFKKDGTYVSAEVDSEGILVPDGDRDDPLVFDVTDESYTVKVVQTVNVKFAENSGNADRTFNGAFMDTHTLEGINFTLTDFEGAALPNVTNVTLSYNYDGDTSKYGGYTSSSVGKTDDFFTLSFTQNGINFTQDGSQTVQYAGNYTPAQLSFLVKGKTYNYTAATGTTFWDSIPTVQVKSAKPTVTISSVDPYQTTKRYYLADTPSSLDQVIQGDFNWISADKLSAVVYVYFNLDDSGRDGEILVPRSPSVTLALSGVPSGITAATMTFQSIEAKFTGTTGKVTVGGGTAGAYGGLQLGSIIDSYPTINAVGMQTSNQISIEYGGETYAVTLSDTVTINQPQYPPYVDFKDITTIDESFTGTTPSRIYGTPQADGTLTITLPGSQTWTSDESSAVDGTFAMVGNAVERTVYTQGDGSWVQTGKWPWQGETRYLFTKYTESKQMYQAQSSQTTWVNTHTITGWKVDGETYQPGKTITITGSTTIVAVVGITEGTKTIKTTTATYYTYTYTQTASATAASVPSGYGTKVSSATNYTTETTYS